MIDIGFIKSYLNFIDLLSGVMGIFLGLIIIILSVYGVINQILIGLTILCISLIYVLIRPKITSHLELSPILLSHRCISILDIIFWILLAISILLWYFNQYHRPTSYFIIIATLSAIIALETFTSNALHRFWPILIKIVFLSFIIRGGIYYNFPSILGADAYSHTIIADIIMVSGYVPSYEIAGKYIYAPILHVFIACTGILCQVSIKNAVFLSIGFGSVISTIFIYIIGKNIAGPQVGLFAALIANLTNDFIVRGIVNITPGSLVICYFLVLLYLFFSETIHLNVRDSLMIFLSFLLIITHQLSTFVVFVIMLTLVLSQVVVQYLNGLQIQKNRNIMYLLIFGIAIISDWINMRFSTGSTFFSNVLGPFIRVVNEGGQYGSDLLVVGRTYEQSLFDCVILQSNYLILPFFAIGGLLLWLSLENWKKFSVAIVAASLFFIVYAVPLLGIRNLLTSRWTPFLDIFLVILAAAFIWQSINLMSARSWKICFIILIAFIFTFLMITTPAVNKDNPLIPETTVRNQFTSSEIQAVKTTGSLAEGNIFVDSAFSKPYFYESRKIVDGNIEFLNQIHIYSISENADSHIEINNLFILRNSTLYEPISVQASDTVIDRIPQNIPQKFFDGFESNHYNKMYDSRYVLGYISL